MKSKILFFLMFLVQPALAGPYLGFEGVLTDADGTLVDGRVTLTFALYAAVEGGDALWSETHPEVEVFEGDFYATLGHVEPFGEALATDTPLWIGLAVDEEAEFTPRTLLTDVPRAAAALWAADVTGQHIHPQAISIGDRPVIDAAGNWVGPGGPGGADREHRFTQISAQYSTACGLQLNGRPLCWGRLEGEIPDLPLTGLSVGVFFACGIRENREILCFGRNTQGQLAAPFDTYTQVATGTSHACGLTVGGAIRCWGNRADGRLDAPMGPFRAVYALGDTSCGLRTDDGRVVCWGPFAPVLNGEGYEQFSFGVGACGLDAQGQATCNGIANPPPGAYQQISVGVHHACAITREGITRCWGENLSGEASLSGPGLVQVVAGNQFTCGRRIDGTATCWGRGQGEADLRVPQRWAP